MVEKNLPTFKIPDKGRLFASFTDDEEQRACFEECFPAPPSKQKLRHNEDAVSFLSEEAFLYYLPFFVESFESDPLGFDMLIYGLDGRLERLSLEARSRYKSELAYWENRLNNIPDRPDRP